MGVPELIAELHAAFPRDRIPAQTMTIYQRKVQDVPLPVLAEVIHEMIATHEHFPTISAIREAVAERTLLLPTESEALTQIETRLRGPAPLHPIVKAVFALLGGIYAYRSADNPSVFRGQFLRLYRDERARAIRDAQIALPGRPPIEVSC